MTINQQAALRKMGERNIEAVIVPNVGWVFPENIRKSAKLAGEVLRTLDATEYTVQQIVTIRKGA